MPIWQGPPPDRSILTPRMLRVVDAALVYSDRNAAAFSLGMGRANFTSILRVVRIRLDRHLRKWQEPVDHEETPRDARARVAADIAAGTRCASCHLLGHVAETCDLRRARWTRPILSPGGMR